jgi:L-amino acid N-acyltransferase
MAIDSGVAVTVREAHDKDVDAMRGIYNHYVLNSVFTFDTSEQTHEERLRWLTDHRKNSLPVLIAEIDGRVAGWASLSLYHSRCAYRTTVEFSVYVDHTSHRKGVGRRLMLDLLAIAEARGYHVIIGMIASENQQSLKMSHALGFETVGELKEVGRKFDRWLNVTFVQKILSP